MLFGIADRHGRRAGHIAAGRRPDGGRNPAVDPAGDRLFGCRRLVLRHLSRPRGRLDCTRSRRCATNEISCSLAAHTQPAGVDRVSGAGRESCRRHAHAHRAAARRGAGAQGTALQTPGATSAAANSVAASCRAGDWRAHAGAQSGEPYGVYAGDRGAKAHYINNRPGRWHAGAVGGV